MYAFDPASAEEYFPQLLGLSLRATALYTWHDVTELAGRQLQSY